MPACFASTSSGKIHRAIKARKMALKKAGDGRNLEPIFSLLLDKTISTRDNNVVVVVVVQMTQNALDA